MEKMEVKKPKLITVVGYATLVIVLLFLIAIAYDVATKPKEVRRVEEVKLQEAVDTNRELKKEYMMLLYEVGYRTGAMNALTNEGFSEEEWKLDSAKVWRSLK